MVVVLGATVICAPVPPVLHMIVPEQLVAVSVALLPAQIVEDGLTVIVGVVGESTKIVIPFEGTLLHSAFLQTAV